MGLGGVSGGQWGRRCGDGLAHLVAKQHDHHILLGILMNLSEPGLWGDHELSQAMSETQPSLLPLPCPSSVLLVFLGYSLSSLNSLICIFVLASPALISLSQPTPNTATPHSIVDGDGRVYLINQLRVTSDFLECPIEDSKDASALSDQKYCDPLVMSTRSMKSEVAMGATDFHPLYKLLYIHMFWFLPLPHPCLPSNPLRSGSCENFMVLCTQSVLVLVEFLSLLS